MSNVVLQREPDNSDVSEEEWAFVAPYIALIREDAPQREHSLRGVSIGMRSSLRTGAKRRMMQHDLPPWYLVYLQAQRWIPTVVFAQIVRDLREIVRLAAGREELLNAIILHGRTLQSTPESGGRSGHDGAKKKKRSKVHMAVETLGHLLTLLVTPADEQERAQVPGPAEQVQEITGGHMELAFADHGYTGAAAAEAAQEQGMRLEVVRRLVARKGFVLLPRRSLFARSFAWTEHFRSMARDYERLPQASGGLHFLAFVCLLHGGAVAARVRG